MFDVFDGSSFTTLDSRVKIPDALLMDATEETPEDLKDAVIGLFISADVFQDPTKKVQTLYDCMVINFILYSARECGETPEDISRYYTMPDRYRKVFQEITSLSNGTPTSEELEGMFGM